MGGDCAESFAEFKVSLAIGVVGSVYTEARDYIALFAHIWRGSLVSRVQAR